ncbi:hypothetical protein [Nocardioides antri]|uniref:Uncharacterized protein n=1 Tax=Nocardioides antri TaxID=2607659 RepID=A0A5B1M0H6_9ACTN|nr:hypothetical protein [Nocardioides antri]KAA1426665.1 hypothetical protein F0U47_13040 [Nocardioides antri]
MKTNPLRIMTLGIAGLVATGLMAFQQSASAGTDQSVLKRDEDTPDVVLVNDDDDDDTNARDTHSANSRSGNSGDASRTGAGSGRDDSRSGRRVKDWTGDNTNTRKRDWSQNRTNDRSRHNTR